MLSKTAIRFEKVYKKYSKNPNHYGTLRDDITRLLMAPKKSSTLNQHEFYAIKNLTFQIRQGESVGLYGPNGSGKSTILKLIAGVMAVTSGQISIRGRIAPLIELGAGFHPDLNGMENIFMNGAILGMSIREIKTKLKQIVEYSQLSDFISTPVKKYSSGMKLRLGFSIAIHSEADIFLFDEILAVGDEEFKKKSYNSIKNLLEKRKTLLIVSHNKEKLLEMTDKIISLKGGVLENSQKNKNFK